jgi:Tol biopolymer transport system component
MFALRPSAFLLVGLAVWSACATSSEHSSTSVPPASVAPPAPQEPRLKNLRQLTFGGENAEAYWSFGGDQLVFQAHGEGASCDRLYRLGLGPHDAPVPVSNGEGAVTCGYFLPGDSDILYASTHGSGAACPPKPDMSQGYVWALHPGYEIYKAKVDGSDLRRLTDSPGYDAEGTVCAKDGSIVFTSVRDGDLELYRMDSDGKNVRRLTSTPGYDGGAFFNADCTRLVWRASRPRPGAELEEYRALLARNLVRPSKLELYVANADGSDPRQLTYLNAASFAPFFIPHSERVLFASNVLSPRGRDFDLFAIDTTGARLERVTSTPGFDSFPMLSPDGRRLAFSSNRATAPGKHDTNIFVADFDSAASPVLIPGAADRVISDITFLAAPAQEGRGLGSAGLERSAAFLEERFRALGLTPGANGHSYRQPFQVTTRVERQDQTRLWLDGQQVNPEALAPLGFSTNGEVNAPLVFAGYGIRAPELGHDDYAGLNVKGKVVLVRRFTPDNPRFEAPENRRYSELRYKTWVAREQGAVGVLIVDAPVSTKLARKDAHEPAEAALPRLSADVHGDAGIAAAVLARSALPPAVWKKLERKQPVTARWTVSLEAHREQTSNIIGRLNSGAPPDKRLPGVVIVGAHYDHLGLGGSFSLAPDKHEPHLGADDNASGVAGLLEVAKNLQSRSNELPRDVVFIAFSGEEMGVLGSTHFTREPPEGLALDRIVAMLNLDMVGRMKANTVTVLGADSAEEWNGWVNPACDAARVQCATSGNGYGPSDQTPFYAAGIPVLHFFTGAHSDYHKPSDTVERINAAGVAQISTIVAEVVKQAAANSGKLTFKNVPTPPSPGDSRSFNASLGTIPDYAGPTDGSKGVLLAGVRPGGSAEGAGLKRGDVLVRLADKSVDTVEDFMFVLNSLRPGQTVPVVVLREGKPLTLKATLQQGRR